MTDSLDKQIANLDSEIAEMRVQLRNLRALFFLLHILLIAGCISMAWLLGSFWYAAPLWIGTSVLAMLPAARNSDASFLEALKDWFLFY